ncbi:MAG TPA: hypothetical protein VI854_01230 [Acidimicrobiia bacterium]|nr:hypothetical protein [Acidimicrobiia bacterium]
MSHPSPAGRTMPAGHVTACAAGLVIALTAVAITGGSAGSLGVLVAALACPIAVVLAMRLLMGDGGVRHHGGRAGATASQETGTGQ